MSAVDYIREVTEKVLYDNWTDTPIAYDSILFDSDKHPRWIRHTLLSGDSFQSAMPACVKYTGLVSIEIFTEQNIGTKTAFMLADKVVSLYGLKNIEGIIFEYGNINRVGYVDDVFKLVVFLPYEYSETLQRPISSNPTTYFGAPIVHNGEVVTHG